MNVRYKLGRLNSDIPCYPGDTLTLTYHDMLGETQIHKEVIRKPKRYSHWAFMEVTDMDGDTITDGIYMGDERLEEWLDDQFPNAERVALGEPLYV